VNKLDCGHSSKPFFLLILTAKLKLEFLIILLLVCSLPDRRVHLKFDDYLREHGIIREDTDGNTVHDRMDRGLRIHGPGHQYTDYYHSEEGIRSWLRSMVAIAYQETLTDYLRIALGHVVLDEMYARYTYPNEEELIKSAYRSFIQRGFGRTYFRP